MGRTLIERVLSEKTGRRVHAGDTIVAPVDQVLLQDGTAPRVFDRLEQLETLDEGSHGHAMLFVDHASPASTPIMATRQSRLLRRARELGVAVSPAGNGISHQLMVENIAAPGQIIVGADSHTCTAGALGAVALGMGSTDVACAIALRETWLQVPESILVVLSGELEPGVSVKDLMLGLVGTLGATGANYMSLEFAGDALVTLDQESRFVLANLAAEVGAKTGIMPTDDTTREYFANHSRPGAFSIVQPDADAKYARRLKLSLTKQEPMLSRPGHHDDVALVTDEAGVAVDQVVIGSCTNGRLSDFAAAAAILKGREIYPDTTLLIVPASRRVMEDAASAGYLKTLLDAGGTLVAPGCGPCVGIHQGVLGANQVCFATQSRNFPGRMGDPTARIYLGSPATAAATALHGRISDPREVVDGA